MEDVTIIPRHSHVKFWLAICLFAVVAGTLALSLYLLSGDLSEAQGRIGQAESEAASTQVELLAAQDALALARSTLESTRSDLASAQAALSAAQGELVAARASLTSSQVQYSDLQATLADLQTSYDRMVSGYDYVLKDPTYQAMVSFLARDNTSDKTYSANSYNCVDFSADIKANAAKEKIRCAYVAVDFPGSTGHALLAFNTIDRDVIYIEPQSDEEVRLEVGEHYYECIIPKPGYYYDAPENDDTILRFVVVW